MYFTIGPNRYLLPDGIAEVAKMVNVTSDIKLNQKSIIYSVMNLRSFMTNCIPQTQ